MAPLRRYLRITQFSVLEVRIYLHKPSDIAWLLSSRDNVLHRIIAAVKPHVLPKLREEVENAKKKGGKKKKGVKDIAESEDFEVSIFLKDASTRHSLLTKRKKFQDKPRIKATGSKLTGWLNTKENPIHVEDEGGPRVLEEQDDEDEIDLRDIPEARPKGKKRANSKGNAEDDALFVSSSDDDFFQTQRVQSTKRQKRRQPVAEEEVEEEEEEEEDDDDQDDKKKLALDTSYDGFSIYGRVLCLIVKRKGGGKKDAPTVDGLAVGGSQMMEQWVSTQANGDAWQDEDPPDG